MSSWLVPAEDDVSVGVIGGVDDIGGVVPLLIGMDIMLLSLLPSDLAYLFSAS